MERVEREGLICDEHLALFVMWHNLGGPTRPPTPLELMAWPAALLKDFSYLSRRLGEIRRRIERES